MIQVFTCDLHMGNIHPWTCCDLDVPGRWQLWSRETACRRLDIGSALLNLENIECKGCMSKVCLSIGPAAMSVKVLLTLIAPGFGVTMRIHKPLSTPLLRVRIPTIGSSLSQVPTAACRHLAPAAPWEAHKKKMLGGPGANARPANWVTPKCTGVGIPIVERTHPRRG